MQTPPVRACGDSVLVDVHVTPSAKEDFVVFSDGVLKVKVTESADRGKANKAVLKLIKPLFGRCKIVSGHKSRKKTILVECLDLAAVKAAVSGLAGA